MWRRRSFHAPNAIAAISAKTRARLMSDTETREHAVHLLIVSLPFLDDPGQRWEQLGCSLHASARMIYS